MTINRTTELNWQPVGYDETNTLSELIFGAVIFANIDDGPDPDAFWISPVINPENIGQVWSLELNTRELGRFETIADAKAAAAEHLLTMP